MVRAQLSRPDSNTALQEEEAPGGVSETGGAVAGTGDAGPLPNAGGGPPDAGAPPPVVAITTRTLAAAPDGTANTRTVVAVNEQVEMTASRAATWTATVGTFAPTSGTTVVWTAPGAPNPTATVTATPAAGAAGTMGLAVIQPTNRALVKLGDRPYGAGKSGSGFTARVTIQPTRVSFARTELREEAVNGVASGYYDTVLHWNGTPHPATSWLSPDASNNGLVDTIGTNAPGGPGPFSIGHFLWAIPQSFRTAGTSGAGTPYSTANHEQDMTGTNGAETTSKEGASRSRTP